MLALSICTMCLHAQKIIFQNYSIQDGLAANHINCIMQDSAGFMWFGTSEGLSKYDGYKFTNYSTMNGLAFNYINDIIEIAPNRFLIAENNGVTDVVEHSEIAGSKRISNVVINKIISAGANKILAVTDYEGLCVFENNTWKKNGEKFISTEISRLSDSFLAVTAMGAPVTILNTHSLKPIGKITPVDYWFTMLYTDPQNTTWVGRSGNGLLILKKQQGDTFTTSKPPPIFTTGIFTHTAVKCMLQDDKANYWIGTNNGLVKIQAGKQQQVFTRQDGLPSNIIHCLLQDREKNIWVGTREGLCKIVTVNNVQILEVGQETGMYGWQQLWKQSEEELFVYTGSSMKKVNTATWQVSPWQGKVITGNGAYFPGKGTPVNYQPAKAAPLFTNMGIAGNIAASNISSSLFACAAKNRYGDMYYGAYDGVLFARANSAISDTLVGSRITTLDFDNKGALWAGTWSNGLYRITTKGEKNMTEDVSYLLPDKSIRSSFEDRDGNFWVGLRNEGLAIIKGYDTAKANTVWLSKKDGLSSDWVKCMAQDSYGNIWVGTNQGLDKIIPHKGKYRVYNFGRINNFSPVIYGIVPLQDDIIWCATSKGLIRVKDFHLDTVAGYATVITAIIPGGAKNKLSFTQLHSNLSLGYQHSAIQFEYAVPSFINEKQILYSYRLLGSSDTSWSGPSTGHAISYGNLQNGDYQFQVRSMGWDGNWGKPATYSFNVRPPFWKTWWFFLAVSLAVLVAVYSFYRYRLSQALKLQSIRNRIATDLHDEIGSTLTNISILSELSNQNLQQPAEAQKFLGRIAEEVNYSGQALDDIIWSVNMHNDSFEELVKRMRRYAGELFDAGQVQYELQFDETLSAIKLNMEMRRDIYLSFKEALNNIYKHAAASSVKIALLKKDGFIILQVTDNGKGFTVTETHRNGLKNMQHRTAKWNGAITINTAPGSGTAITIRLPAGK